MVCIWIDREKTGVSRDGMYIPTDPDNTDYAAILAAGEAIEDYVAPPPSEHDAVREYERRLFAILGARDLAHAAYVRADNEAELRELARSGADPARNLELLETSASVARLIARYNEVPTPPPLDYTDDRHWN